jgi:hypothetical protein
MMFDFIAGLIAEPPEDPTVAAEVDWRPREL